MNPYRSGSISLSLNKASSDSLLSDLGDFTALATGYFGCTEKLHLVFQLPYASSSESETDTMQVYPSPYPSTYKSTSAVIGNPYVGIELADNQRSSRVLQFGVRIPNISPNSYYTANSPDPRLRAARVGMIVSHEQFDAFAPDLFTAHAAIGQQYYSQKANHWFYAKVVGGVTVLKYTKEHEELCVDFHPEFWFLRRSVEYGFGLSARMLMTEAGKDLSDRIDSQLGFALNAVSGKVRPGVHLRIPLGGSIDDEVDFLFGGHVTLDLQ